MYKLSNEQFAILMQAWKLLPAGEAYRRLSTEEQDLLVQADSVWIDVIRKKRTENKAFAKYVAERRKTDKNYCRPKNGRKE